MLAKYFLLAALGVSIQVLGDEELSPAISVLDGIKRAEEIRLPGLVILNKTYRDIRLFEAVSLSTIRRCQKNGNLELNEVKENLRNISTTLRKGAAEMRKPQSVFECFGRVEKEANEKLENLFKIFNGDMGMLKEGLLQDTNSSLEYLEDRKSELDRTYEMYLGKIKENSQQHWMLKTLISFETYVNKWEFYTSEMQNSINRKLSDYHETALKYYNSNRTEITNVRSDFIGNMTECLDNGNTGGEELQNAIKNALSTLEGLKNFLLLTYNTHYEEIDNYGYRAFLRVEKHINDTEGLLDDVEKDLRNVTKTVKEIAKNSNKTQAVFQCIDRAAAETEVFRNLTENFYADMEQINENSAKHVEYYVTSIKDTEERCRRYYRESVSKVKNSKHPTSVKNAVDYFERHVSLYSITPFHIRVLLGSNLKEITTKSETIFTSIIYVTRDVIYKMEECLKL